MHELSVTESLLEIALRHAQNAGARRVTELNIVIGQLSSIVDDSVQFYWDMISEGTIAEKAALHFRRIAPELVCQDCQHRYTASRDGLSCPHCGGIRVKIEKGEEFFLDSIQIET